jgi:hypothetical protein
MMVLIAFYTEQPLTVSTNDPAAADLSYGIRMAPNPVSGTATFTLPEGITEVRQFRIMNMTGQLVFQQSDLQGNVFDIDLSSIPAGFYVFEADGRIGKLYKL